MSYGECPVYSPSRKECSRDGGHQGPHSWETKEVDPVKRITTLEADLATANATIVRMLVGLSNPPPSAAERGRQGEAYAALEAENERLRGDLQNQKDVAEIEDEEFQEICAEWQVRKSPCCEKRDKFCALAPFHEIEQLRFELATANAKIEQLREALEAIDALFDKPLNCLLTKARGEITNGDQAIIDAAFIKLTAALADEPKPAEQPKEGA